MTSTAGNIQKPAIAILLCLSTIALLFARPPAISDSRSSDGLSKDDISGDGGGATENFCKGMHMVMSMSGFQWSLFQQQGDCLNYFSPNWKLDNPGKFQGAMVYSFLLAISTEGFYFLQTLILPKVPKRLRHLVSSLLIGLQRFMGYIIMLIAMMYSWELLISIILGLMVGRMLFPNSTRRAWKGNTRRLQDGTLPVHPTLASTLDESQHQASDTSLLAGDPVVRRRRS